MSDAGNKGLPPAPGPLPEGSGFGKPQQVPKAPAHISVRAPATRRRRRPPRAQLPPEIQRQLAHAVVGFTGTLKRNPVFKEAIQADCGAFRAALLVLMRRQFPLKRGPRPDPLLDAACRMAAQGKSVPDVLREQIRDWEKLDPYTRLLASKGLHAAYRRRYPRKSRPKSRRKKPLESPAP